MADAQPQPWRVFITKRAESDLAGLPAEQQERIRSALMTLDSGLSGRDIRKLQGAAETWALRVGVYRAIFEIDDEARKFVVHHVRPRREAYRDR